MRIQISLLTLLLGFIASSVTQEPEFPAPSAFEDPCFDDIGVRDNIKCPRGDGLLQCIPDLGLLCDGDFFCTNGDDEGGINVNALDCDGFFTGIPEPRFRCTSGEVLNLTSLCDGINDCVPDVMDPISGMSIRQPGADDEVGALCENKCRYPYYGNCPYSRECQSSEFFVNCGLCRPGWAQDLTSSNPNVDACVFASFRFSLQAFDVVESAGELMGSITLDTTGRTDRAITFLVEPRNSGSATLGGVDAASSVVSVVFPRGSLGGATREFTIAINNDLLVEETESFLLVAMAVNNLGNFSMGGDMATANIIDDDMLMVGYEQDLYTVTEGQTAEVCMIPLNNAVLLNAATVNVGTSFSEQASAADADPTTDVLSFNSASTRECWSIRTIDDNIDEITECFVVTSSPTSSGINVDPARSTARVCIQDNDALDFNFTQSIYDVGEGDSFARVCVMFQAGVLQRDLDIVFNTQDRTALSSSPVDYTAQFRAIVTFPSGSAVGTQRCLDIPINDDNLVEVLESFTVVASSADSEVMFPDGNAATVEITDNDIPRFEFVDLSFGAMESDGAASSSLRLLNAELTFSIVVRVQDIVGGSATQGDDYDQVGAFITFFAGDGPGMTRAFSVAINDDNLVEGLETVDLQLSILNAIGEVVAGRDQATVNILDNDRCEVRFEMADYTVREANIMQQVCLIKSNNALLTAPVDVAVFTTTLAPNPQKDSALAGSDYASLPMGTTVTFQPGSRRECVEIQINEDSVDERNEFFGVAATSSNAAQLQVVGGSATVCITDDDLVMIRFVQNQISVNEGDGTAHVCLEIASGSAPRSITIDLNTADNTATSADYTEGPYSVTFNPVSVGAMECTDIPVQDDILVELLETFQVTVSSSDNQVTFPNGNLALISITDNDIPEFLFDPTSYSVNEGDGMAQLVIRLIQRELTFDISLSIQDLTGGTATQGDDYEAVNTIVTFMAGDGPGTTRSLEVTILEDLLVENSEMLTLELTVLGNFGSIASGGGQATVEILDNDRCEVRFEMADYTVREANIMQQVCLIKSNNALLTAPVDVAVFTTPLAPNAQKDSALAGSDYASLPMGTTVTFQPGSSRECVEIQINEDSVDERNEFFGVAATSSTAAQLQVVGGSATVCITDDDLLMVHFVQNQVSVNEGDGTARVCLEIASGSATRSITIDLFTAANTATSADYTEGPYSVTFNPASVGAMECTEIPVQDDILVELLETFQVTASSSDNQVTFPNGNLALISITDNDSPRFAFVSLMHTANEDQGTLQIEVELLDRELTFPITVRVNDAVGGTATVGADYDDISTVLTFMAGDGPGTRRLFLVSIRDDLFDEPTETILLEGAADAPGTFPVNPATIEIIDEDQCLIGFEETSYDVTEGQGRVELCLVKRNNVVLARNVDVLVSTGPAAPQANKDAATAGDDFTLFTQTLTFGPGSDRMCVNISITDDAADERTENLRVTATSSDLTAIGLATGQESAEVCIQDNDLIVFAFTESTYTTEEGQPIVQACIELIEGVLTRDVPVTVMSNEIGSATMNSDYTPLNENLLFPDGSMPGDQMCFDLPIINDLITEDIENYQLRATSTDSEAEFETGRDTALVSILDNDRVPIRIIPDGGVGVPDFTIPEENGPLEVCVEVYNVSPQSILEKTVTVMLSTSDGSAMSPADYGAITQTFVFNEANQDSIMCLNISITSDVICEGDETFMIELTSTDDCVDIRPPPQGTVTIIDDDVATVGPDQGIISYNVTERIDEAVWIPIRLTGQKGPGRECVIDVSTMDATAEAPMDYTPLVTSLTFDSTTDLQNIHIEINDDTVCEGHESFLVYLNSRTPESCQVSQNELTVYIWDDEIHFGDDPHFSIALPGGNLLCYTVQGEHGFSFNLINNEMIVMNSKFVPDARRSEVTWLGSMGIIVQDSKYKGSNSTKLRFESSDKSIHIGDKIALQAKNIEKITFSKGKLTISEAPPATSFRYPSVMVDLKDVEISFTIKFTNQHLDMYWHNTGKKITKSHGLIGQFFREGVEIDETRKILIMPYKEPVPVMRRPVWAFMEREEKDDQLCWTAMNAGYQGEGLIDGTYFDYLVDDVMSTDFKFNKL